MALFGLEGLDTSSFTSMLFKLFSSFFFWFIALIAFVITVIGGLWFRKKRKLRFPTYVLTDLGKGKMGIETKLKCGWFKHRVTLFGLYDYGGEEILKTSDGRQIIDASSEDFQEINGVRGIVCIRSPEDPRILIPVTKMSVKNGELINEIAPASFRETAVNIIKQTEKETSDKWEKITQWIIFGGVIIFALISIILIVQMVKNGQSEAKDLILEAGRINKENIQTICSGYVSDTVASGAP